MKKCSKCGKIKTLDDFYRSPGSRGGIDTRCKMCNSLRHAGWVKNNPERSKYHNLKGSLKRHNITIEEFDQLLERQDGRCAICYTDTPNGMGRFTVDHDHATGKVRGLLCSTCNMGLGSLRDDPVLLRNAANYLDLHKDK